jgi:glycosyltransferase involved in cell wall biosynthesis
VLASNAASLPEVVGDAGLLVSPHDREGIVAGLVRLLTDSTENARLRECSLRQAARFSWAKTADLTLRAYEATVAHLATARRSHAA